MSLWESGFVAFRSAQRGSMDWSCGREGRGTGRGAAKFYEHCTQDPFFTVVWYEEGVDRVRQFVHSHG